VSVSVSVSVSVPVSDVVAIAAAGRAPATRGEDQGSDECATEPGREFHASSIRVISIASKGSVATLGLEDEARPNLTRHPRCPWDARPLESTLYSSVIHHLKSFLYQY